MLTISLMNQKGGAGKSTVARALLSAADGCGMRCAFIDADHTGNLASWRFAPEPASFAMTFPLCFGYQHNLLVKNTLEKRRMKQTLTTPQCQ